MERMLTARLLAASGRIQADLSDSCGPGTVSFWRAGGSWQQTYLHHPMWESGHRMLFIDANSSSNHSGLDQPLPDRHRFYDMPVNTLFPCFIPRQTGE